MIVTLGSEFDRLVGFVELAISSGRSPTRKGEKEINWAKLVFPSGRTGEGRTKARHGT